MKRKLGEGEERRRWGNVKDGKGEEGTLDVHKGSSNQQSQRKCSSSLGGENCTEDEVMRPQWEDFGGEPKRRLDQGERMWKN